MNFGSSIVYLTKHVPIKGCLVVTGGSLFRITKGDPDWRGAYSDIPVVKGRIEEYLTPLKSRRPDKRPA